MNEIVDCKQQKHKIPDRFNIKGKTVTQPLEISNTFNHYFATIGKNMANKIPLHNGYESYVRQSYGQFDLAIPDCETVEKIMKKQPPKMSCGKDTINNKIVKLCCKELAEPITTIIANSIREARVPGPFKLARIIPLYKKGQANNYGNYRLVSLLSALSKIMEKVVFFCFFWRSPAP